ncbi:DUF1236 domain-containing protein [Tardiphaga sp. 709]|nr:DUF1236 domain-containing protein [Tardiphaga sp. 709]WNV08181.1 DUF1236 domain-containing protein [Tardiphaga sp. 709]
MNKPDQAGWHRPARKPDIVHEGDDHAKQTYCSTALVGALGTPLAVQAQGVTVGVSGGDRVIVDNSDPDGITVQERPAFREYVVRERVPTFTVPDRIVVGTTLPDAGVTYYDVPQTVATTPYRYTVVNGQTVLVEPRSRRIVQVID